MNALPAALALLAAFCFALAATLWQKAALDLTGVSLRHPKSVVVLLTRWVWLLGLAAQIVGVAVQAAALDRGRVSIIQPLLVTRLDKNPPWHAVVAVGALCLALVGSVVVSSAKETPEEMQEASPELQTPVAGQLAG